MSDFPLSINAIFRHGRHVHAASQCVTFTGDGAQRASYRQVADNADRLAAALKGLGVEPGDPVGTFMWNDQEHLEAYFAVPCMGAVLHTLNIRLSAEQLVYVVNHAGDRVVLVDTSLLPVIGAVASELSTVEAWIVVGDGDASALVATGRPVHRYHELLAASGWPRTGDVGTVTPNGYMQITDRAKDVIKSGGEWISSVELENALMAHPAVVE
ncbi:MAG TPA: AMP-binding protein, partial [Acidimicrobiales bacterium]|nr:AMP-binding protein [Acidimicrobiales bacterium]